MNLCKLADYHASQWEKYETWEYLRNTDNCDTFPRFRLSKDKMRNSRVITKLEPMGLTPPKRVSSLRDMPYKVFLSVFAPRFLTHTCESGRSEHTVGKSELRTTTWCYFRKTSNSKCDGCSDDNGLRRPLIYHSNIEVISQWPPMVPSDCFCVSAVSWSAKQQYAGN